MKLPGCIPDLLPFSSLEHAIESVDEVVDVSDFLDPEEERNPEANNLGCLVQKISKVKTPDGKDLIDKLKISVYDIKDLRDLKRHIGVVVLEGRGFLICKPRVPSFWLQDNQEMLQLDEPSSRCARTMEDTKLLMNNLARDDARLYMTILFLFPDTVSLTADFTSYIPNIDVKAKRRLRIFEKTIPSGKNKTDKLHVFFPVFWEMRVIFGQRRTALINTGDLDSDVEDATEGMQQIKLA